MQAQLRDAELEEQLRLARAEAARLGAELAKLQRASVQALMDTGAKATRSAQACKRLDTQPRRTQRATYDKAQAVGCRREGPVGIHSCCNWRRRTVLPAGVPRVPRGTPRLLGRTQGWTA